MKIASRILFIEIVNTLKKTKNNPNHPNITAIDNKLEPKSRCSKFCIIGSKFDIGNSTLLNYLLKIKMTNIQIYLNSLLLDYLRELIYELEFIYKIN